jgi:hypothetical protein
MNVFAWRFLLIAHCGVAFFARCWERLSVPLVPCSRRVRRRSPRQVRLRGKGRKEGVLPLSPETANALHRLRGMSRTDSAQCVFVNRNGQPLQVKTVRIESSLCTSARLNRRTTAGVVLAGVTELPIASIGERYMAQNRV